MSHLPTEPLSIPDFARYLMQPLDKIRRMVYQGQLKTTKKRPFRILPEEIDRFHAEYQVVPDDMADVKTIADRLQVPESTVANIINRHHIRGTKIWGLNRLYYTNDQFQQIRRGQRPKLLGRELINTTRSYDPKLHFTVIETATKCALPVSTLRSLIRRHQVECQVDPKLNCYFTRQQVQALKQTQIKRYTTNGLINVGTAQRQLGLTIAEMNYYKRRYHFQYQTFPGDQHKYLNHEQYTFLAEQVAQFKRALY